jgi:16S rRNA processing protein RimM
MSVYVNIGRVAASHGVKGWMKVLPLTDDPERFSLLERVFLAKADGTGRREAAVEDVKYQGTRILIKFEGLETPEAASAFKGLLIQIPEEEVPPIEEEDTYYVYQLEGMAVYDDRGELIGKLDYIFQAGANDVYAVKAPDGKEYMVPALKKCIRRVDIEKKMMVVDREWMT